MCEVNGNVGMDPSSLLNSSFLCLEKNRYRNSYIGRKLVQKIFRALTLPVVTDEFPRRLTKLRRVHVPVLTPLLHHEPVDFAGQALASGPYLPGAAVHVGRGGAGPRD